LDSGVDLVKNAQCACSYHIHKRCLNALSPMKCPLCRKEIQKLSDNEEHEESTCCVIFSAFMLVLFVLSIVLFSYMR
jgi:hypothetical protein